jgi:hypothetical protein
MPSEASLRRLAFIRGLFRVGAEQSRAQEPLCAAAILQFHDSVELFLHLASEHLKVGAPQPTFMQYFDLIDPGLAPRVLGHKEAMRRLNKTRVQLKHNGVLPSRIEIEGFRASTAAFFDENTPVVFGLEFSAISLAHLISSASVREDMLAADGFITKHDRGSAIERIAIAFARLVQEYEPQTGFGGREPYIRRPSRRDLDEIPSRELQPFLEDLMEAFDHLRQQVASLSLGLDIIRLRRFRQLTPAAAVVPSGVSDTWTEDRHRQISEEDLQFCYDFVVDSALKLERGVAQSDDT